MSHLCCHKIGKHPLSCHHIRAKSVAWHQIVINSAALLQQISISCVVGDCEQPELSALSSHPGLVLQGHEDLSTPPGQLSGFPRLRLEISGCLSKHVCFALGSRSAVPWHHGTADLLYLFMAFISRHRDNRLSFLPAFKSSSSYREVRCIAELGLLLNVLCQFDGQTEDISHHASHSS